MEKKKIEIVTKSDENKFEMFLPIKKNVFEVLNFYFHNRMLRMFTVGP